VSAPATPPDRLRVAAHAKLNLFLRILARERDGYHQIETAFTLLELADEIVVSRAPAGVALTIDGPDLGPEEENLAVRAARAVLAATGEKFGVAIALVKRIPVRAGLGGGSSDAAAVLHAVNALAQHAVPRHELLHFATRLGADVAFFAGGAPLALAWGRGERMYRLAPLPTAPALIVVPSVAVATPDAYRWWDEMQPETATRGPVLLDAPALASWGSVGRLGGNDFEAPVFGKHPELRAVYERVAQTGPLWVRLCGSGSAVAAVYKNERDRDDATHALGRKDVTVITTNTRAVAAPGPEPQDERRTT
jgi:4-diphosphocytidyl-2-C-methyl-D-erythritol kinase